MKNIPHMKKKMSILTIGLVISLGVCAAGINYNGTNLTLNNEFNTFGHTAMRTQAATKRS